MLKLVARLFTDFADGIIHRITEGLLHRWGRSAEELVETVPSPGGLYVKVVPPPDTNKNTSWFQYPGIWTTYILIILFSWLAIVSAFQCEAGTAWTVVNLVHFAVSHLLRLLAWITLRTITFVFTDWLCLCCKPLGDVQILSLEERDSLR